MILMIAGSRKNIGPEYWQELKQVIASNYINVTMIIHGGANGADTVAKIYCKENLVKEHEIKPNYGIYGKAAPIIRNKQLAQMADVGLIIWNGERTKGTLHARKCMHEQNVPYHEYDIATKKLTWSTKQEKLM